MGGIAFDWTINVGQVFMMIGLAGSAVLFMVRLVGKLEGLGVRMEKVEEAMQQEITLLVKVAEQNARLDGLDRRWTELIANYNERLSVHNQRLASLESDRRVR